MRELQTEKEMIVTRYGKPVAIIVPVTEENLEDALNLARRQGPERASCATLKSTARRGKPVT